MPKRSDKIDRPDKNQEFFRRSNFRKIDFYHFTIVELLVVIAIIAILASILLPALNQARERGKTVSCTNNLKNLSFIFRAYLDDYNSCYPPRNAYPSGWWWGLRLAYTEEIKNFSLFQCPSDQVLTPMTYFLSYSPTKTVSKPLSYAYGSVDMVNERSFRRSPSRICILIDAVGPWVFISNTSYWNLYRAYRHGMGSNMLFADHHVSWKKTEEISGIRTDYPWNTEKE